MDPGPRQTGFSFWPECPLLVRLRVSCFLTLSFIPSSGKKEQKSHPTDLVCGLYEGECGTSCHAVGLGCSGYWPHQAPLAAAQVLKLNPFYFQTQFQGWFQLCPPDLGRYPKLRLAPGFCPQSCQSLGIHHAQTCPHLVTVCMKQSRHRDRWPGTLVEGEVFHTWPPLAAPQTGPTREGSPCQLKWGLSQCLAASQLLACSPTISIYVCRWLGPLFLPCYLARTEGFGGIL